ncbi:DUF6408 family protein [Streptomyces sp. NPDC050095]
MVPVEYTPKRRTWLRDILIGVATGLGVELVKVLVESTAHLIV